MPALLLKAPPTQPAVLAMGQSWTNCVLFRIVLRGRGWWPRPVGVLALPKEVSFWVVSFLSGLQEPCSKRTLWCSSAVAGTVETFIFKLNSISVMTTHGLTLSKISEPLNDFSPTLQPIAISLVIQGLLVKYLQMLNSINLLQYYCNRCNRREKEIMVLIWCLGIRSHREWLFPPFLLLPPNLFLFSLALEIILLMGTSNLCSAEQKQRKKKLLSGSVLPEKVRVMFPVEHNLSIPASCPPLRRNGCPVIPKSSWKHHALS